MAINIALVIAIIAIILLGLLAHKLNTTLKNKSVNAAAIPVGQSGCTVDWDCDGWSLFGDIACCRNTCVEKNYSLQTCDSFCTQDPIVCTPHVGN